MTSRLRALLIATLLPCISAFIIPQSAQANPMSNGNTDIFVLDANQATNNPRQATVIADFDWFKDGDKIGLANGLTEADLDYRERVDFDQDGMQDDAVIKLKSSQEILAIVLDADDFVLAGEFFSMAANEQPVACLQKANVAACKTSAPR
ncbi:MAG: hypothetical protein ACRC8A_08340 [Microcoleaceae cyanobacterium]